MEKKEKLSRLASLQKLKKQRSKIIVDNDEENFEEEINENESIEEVMKQF